MNLVLKTTFRDYGNGVKHVHIPAIVVKTMGIKNGDVLEVDCVNGVITLKKLHEVQNK